MTKLENRCANCGGKFGLVYHNYWGLRFCRKVCKDDFLAKTARGHAFMRRLLGRAAFSKERNRPIWRQTVQAETEAESGCNDTKPVAVGTRITPRPPHRSRRALLTHRAPPSGFGVEAVTWQRV
jgi:hypothetical protein